MSRVFVYILAGKDYYGTHEIIRRNVMEIIRLYPTCVKCLLDKQLNKCPENAPLEKKVEYVQKIMQIVASAPKYTSAPVLVRRMYDLQKEMFGICTDYTEIKSCFNQLILGIEDRIWENICSAKEPLKRAVQYAMVGNYIDFAALKNVDEDSLFALIEKAGDVLVDEKELSGLKEELTNGGNLLYILDNCGEIVLDKLFMRYIKENYPKVKITAMVRGGDIMNDATRTDAKEVNLEKVATITDSGLNIAGTSLENVSDDVQKMIDSADVIIAKGQGNFETMHQCGKNIYYIFMCKCEMFMKRFSLPKFSSVLVHEENIPKAGGL